MCAKFVQSDQFGPNRGGGGALKLLEFPKHQKPTKNEKTDVEGKFMFCKSWVIRGFIGFHWVQLGFVQHQSESKSCMTYETLDGSKKGNSFFWHVRLINGLINIINC